VQNDESDNDNKDAEDPQDPAIDLDAHRGLRAQRETARRRNRTDVRADQDTRRENQASLEKHLFAGPAVTWPQVAEKAGYLLRLFATTGEGQDPRYRQLIEDTLRDFERLAANTTEPPL
jgi:hypothetical protein